MILQLLQHCWGCVCVPARWCISTSRSWHWDTAIYQSWHVTCGRLASRSNLNPVDCRLSGVMQERTCQVAIGMRTNCCSGLLTHRIVVDAASDRWQEGLNHVSAENIIVTVMLQVWNVACTFCSTIKQLTVFGTVRLLMAKYSFD